MVESVGIERMRVKYYLPELGECPEDAQEIKDPPFYLTNVAEEAAEHFYSKRCGWECSWPLQFTIIDDAGQEHRFVVDRESVPQFRAAKLKRDYLLDKTNSTCYSVFRIKRAKEKDK